jgi:hypothetical protein
MNRRPPPHPRQPTTPAPSPAPPQSPLRYKYLPAGIATLFCLLATSSSARTNCIQTSAYMGAAVRLFLTYVSVGVFFAIYGVCVALGGEARYVVAEWAKAEGRCGNKFLECRGWD